MRVLALLLVLAAGGVLWEVQAEWRAQLHLVRGLQAHKNGAFADALSEMAQAANGHDWYWRVRVQLPLTLVAAVGAYRNRMAISHEAADIAFEKGRSASPESPALMLARIEYLLDSGRWLIRQMEVDDLLARLERNGALYPATERARRYYAMKRKED